MIPSFSGDLWIPLVFIILVALIFSGRLGNKDRKDTENTERLEKTPRAKEHTEAAPASKDNHGVSHGSSGGHGDGGHGGGILSTLATIAFVAVCGFGIYLFAQELQSIPPKTMHPIQVQEASSNSAPLDTDPAHYCKAPAPDATSYPAKSEEWTEVSVTPGGFEFCTNPGPATGLVEFECRTDEGGSWESCGQTFLFVRFKSKMPVTVWQEPYHS